MALRILHNKFLLVALGSFIIVPSCLLASLLASSLRSAPDEIRKSVDTRPNGILLNQEISVWHGQEYRYLDYEKVESKIGSVFPLHSKIRHVVKNYTDPVYDVYYNINGLGLRELPSRNMATKKHIIVAGDSNTFGNGVKDEETIPQILSKQRPDYRGYNFGICGSAPNATLALMEFLPWKKLIKESEGTMVYIMYPHWMTMRLIGSKGYLKWAGKSNPWYELDESNHLLYKGNFNDRALTYFFKFINFVDIFNLVGEIPRINIGHIKLLSKVFLKMKQEYLKQFPKGKFVVALSHYDEVQKDYMPELLEMLHKDLVDVVNIHSHHVENIKYHFADYHFNKQGQEFVVSELLQQLKL
jgi:hypothetical protein